MDVFLVACRICHAPRQALFRAGDATGCGQLYRIIALLVPSLRQS